MICPNCSHTYPISNGIPNMVSLPPRPLAPSSPCRDRADLSSLPSLFASPPSSARSPLRHLLHSRVPQLLAEHEITA